MTTVHRPWLEAYADNYRNDEVVYPHCHTQAQLIHGVTGVMVVSTAQGLAVSVRACLWYRRDAHEIRMAGECICHPF